MSDIISISDCEVLALKYLRKINADNQQAILKNFLLNEYETALTGTGVTAIPREFKIVYEYFPELDDPGDRKELNERLLDARLSVASHHVEFLPAHLRYCLQFLACNNTAQDRRGVIDVFESILPKVLRIKFGSRYFNQATIDAWYNPIGEFMMVPTNILPWQVIELFLNALRGLYQKEKRQFGHLSIMLTKCRPV